MAYNINISQQQTRDELGSESDVNFVFKRFAEKMRLIHGPTKIKVVGIADSFILNSTSNGVLDEDILGDRRTSGTVERIENGNNTFNERFWLSDYIESNTGTINYATGVLRLDVGDELTSTSVFYDRSGTKRVSSATPSIPVSGTFNISISADGWVTSSTIGNNETLYFTESSVSGTPYSCDSGIFDTLLFDASSTGDALAGSDLRIAFSNAGVSSVSTGAYSLAYTTY